MDFLSTGVNIIKQVNKFRYAKYDKVQDPDPSFNPLPTAVVRSYNNARLLGPQKYICHAPFVNMYFGVDGNVTACCYNRNYPFGNILTSTIQEMWTGDAAQLLRKHIVQHDFSHGCEKCELAIRSGSYNMVEAASYDRLKPEKDIGYPKRMVFELSSTCNLACKMCNGHLSSTFRKDYENEVPYPDVYTDDFFQQLKPYLKQVEHTNFLGGEPFLINLYYDIWEYILQVNKKCKLHLQTNGMVLNNKVKSILEKGKFNIGISIDSLEEGKFESIRKHADLKRWMSNLEYFKSYAKRKHTDLSIVCTPMVDNIYEIPDFLNFANNIDAYLYLNTLSEPEEMAINSLDVATLQDYLNQLKQQKGFLQKSFIHKANLNVFLSYIKQIAFIIITKEQEEKQQRDETEKGAALLKEEERLVMEKMTVLKEVSFEEIKEVVLDKMKQGYADSADYGKFDVNVFLQEFKEKTDKAYQKDSTETLNTLKLLTIYEGEKYFVALKPFIDDSLKRYKII